MTDKHNDSLDGLLAQNLVTPPDHFTDKVITRLADQLPVNYTARTTRSSGRQRLWPTAAIATGAAVGFLQIISFIFGIWIPATVG